MDDAHAAALVEADRGDVVGLDVELPAGAAGGAEALGDGRHHRAADAAAADAGVDDDVADVADAAEDLVPGVGDVVAALGEDEGARHRHDEPAIERGRGVAGGELRGEASDERVVGGRGGAGDEGRVHQRSSTLAGAGGCVNAASPEGQVGSGRRRPARWRAGAEARGESVVS